MIPKDGKLAKSPNLFPRMHLDSQTWLQGTLEMEKEVIKRGREPKYWPVLKLFHEISFYHFSLIFYFFDSYQTSKKRRSPLVYTPS